MFSIEKYNFFNWMKWIFFSIATPLEFNFGFSMAVIFIDIWKELEHFSTRIDRTLPNQGAKRKSHGGTGLLRIPAGPFLHHHAGGKASVQGLGKPIWQCWEQCWGSTWMGREQRVSIVLTGLTSCLPLEHLRSSFVAFPGDHW